MRRTLLVVALLCCLSACSDGPTDEEKLLSACAVLEQRGQSALDSARDYEFGLLAAEFDERCIQNGIGYGEVDASDIIEGE